MNTLAESNISSLTSLSIEYELSWFHGREECIGPLLALLARQPDLQSLSIILCGVTHAQQVAIKSAVSNPNCKLYFCYGDTIYYGKFFIALLALRLVVDS